MSNEVNLFPLLGAAAGMAMLVFGWLKKRKVSSVTSAPLRPSGGLAPGVPQVISGRVSAPVELKAPVSGRPCAFFLAEIDIARFVQSRRGGASIRWVPSENLSYGFFFVDDSFGRALVCPTCGSLDLIKSSESDGGLFPAEGDRRTTEQLILQGEEVTVLGSPLPLSAFLDYVRATPELSLPAAGLEQLIGLAKDPAGAAIHCFYGRGVSVVADQAYSDYISWKSSSASSYIWGGLAVALVSAWIFAQPFLAAGQRTVQ
ncbi:MAG: hypothetical protein FD189_1380 [Elusimicrobia bacterium]|nr:MAG: hypothetical protein FD154_1423 [Elusimicrobiota bacterium]KAF0155464.1 MAG: hypothetical protein FD189_1380 [Elusimicrobiota bacterium]